MVPLRSSTCRKAIHQVSSSCRITLASLKSVAGIREVCESAERLIEECRVNRENIEEINTWLSTQALPKLTDEQIVVFLLSCCNDLEATKKTIEAYITVKISCRKVHANWTLEREDLQLQMKTGEICVIPERRSDGCAVLLFRLKDTHYRNLDMAGTCALLAMAVEAMVYDNPPTGMVVVVDMQGVGLMHLTRIRFELLKPCFKFLQEGLPVALKEIHMLNTVYFMDKILSIMKPFIMKKVLDMFIFHKSGMDMEEFYEQWVPKRCLPEDYGGDLPPLQELHQRNIQKLKQMQPYFEATERQRENIGNLE